MCRFSGWTLAVALLVGCEPDFKAVTEALEQPASTNTEQPAVSGPSDEEGTISILAWNVESGGNDPAVISQQLSAFTDYDVVCLSEVRSENFQRYADALGQRYKPFNGKTGRNDRLQILVDQTRFEILESREMAAHGDYTLNKGSHRSPLYVRLKARDTGVEFVVMTNHLARGNADFRTEQAIGLREWARDQSAGVIAIGDFNMDFDYIAMKGNDAFDEMVRDNIWS